MRLRDLKVSQSLLPKVRVQWGQVFVIWWNWIRHRTEKRKNYRMFQTNPMTSSKTWQNHCHWNWLVKLFLEQYIQYIIYRHCDFSWGCLAIMSGLLAERLSVSSFGRHAFKFEPAITVFEGLLSFGWLNVTIHKHTRTNKKQTCSTPTAMQASLLHSEWQQKLFFSRVVTCAVGTWAPRRARYSLQRARRGLKISSLKVLRFRFFL